MFRQMATIVMTLLIERCREGKNNNSRFITYEGGNEIWKKGNTQSRKIFQCWQF